MTGSQQASTTLNLPVFVEAFDGQPLQVLGTLRGLRRGDADLGEMRAQRVERRRLLAGEQLAGLLSASLGLVLDRMQSHEPLARPPRGLANRRRRHAGTDTERISELT